VRGDQLRAGGRYAMRVPGTRKREMVVVELRHFLSRATGNVIVRPVTGERRDSMIVSPADLWYEVAFDGATWRKVGNRSIA
jgi:hypothetical protein